MFTIKEVVQKYKHRFLKEVQSLWCKQMYVYIDKEFAISGFKAKVLILILTGKFCRGVKNMARLRRILTGSEYTFFVAVNSIICHFHTQNTLCIRRIYFEHDHL